MFESWIRYEVLAAEERARREHYRKRLLHSVQGRVDDTELPVAGSRRWRLGDLVRLLVPVRKRTSRTG